MTTIDLYRKHKAGEISREKFLYEVRRDPNLSTFITNLTSYDDAVKILKNKGIVTEAPVDEDFNFIKKMKDFAGEKGWTFSARRPTEEEDKIGREYMRSQGKEFGSIGVDRITGNINVMEPNGDFRAILSSDGEELSAYEMDIHENLNESEAKAYEAVKAEVKPKATTFKKQKTLHIDIAHPYEYRLGIQQELNTLDEYTDEAFKKSKIKVLKNLAKDANFYTTLLNAKTSPYTFKKTETDEKGMQARPDGYLKKEAKKDEKSNVKDNLGNKEAGTTKPKGITIMPDKGVTGSEKTIKEGIKEHHNDPNFPGGTKIYAMLDKVADEWGKDSDIYNDLEDAIVGWSDRNNELTPKGKIAIKALLSNWDLLDDYGHFLDENIEEGLETNDLEVKWTEKYLNNNKKDPYFYSEKGLASDFEMADDKKVKEIVGYFEDEDGDEDEEVIGYIYSKSEKDIETEYNEDDLDDAFTGALGSMKEGSFMGGVDLGASFDKMKQDIVGNKEDFELADENTFTDLMKKYDWYYEMSDDSGAYDRGKEIDQKLKVLAKKIGIERAVELFNQKAPQDRKANTSFFTMNEDKHTKIKEKLKQGLKELITPADVAAAKRSGKPINVSSTNTMDIASLKTAKANFTTYE